MSSPFFLMSSSCSFGIFYLFLYRHSNAFISVDQQNVFLFAYDFLYYVKSLCRTIYSSTDRAIESNGTFTPSLFLLCPTKSRCIYFVALVDIVRRHLWAKLIAWLNRIVSIYCVCIQNWLLLLLLCTVRLYIYFILKWCSITQ